MIRAATPDDARAIALVKVRAWLVNYEDVVPPQELMALDVDELAAQWAVRIPEDDVLVAEAGGRLVGFAATGPAKDPSAGDAGELYYLYVDPAAQGAGLGGALLAAAEERLRERYAVAILFTFEANGLARTFYERHGWVLEPGVGRPEGDERAAAEVRYRKALA